jgi:SAM-dependent methyltransferase
MTSDAQRQPLAGAHSAPSPSSVDWGVGSYERTAAQLMPIARIVVDAAAIERGDRVVDVGTGTGNAALLAATRGAIVAGIDPSARLLAVARERATAGGLDAAFVTGTAADLPLGDAAADIVMSVFGVIFAPDPAAAVAEMARVTAPGGRIVLSAWIPGGAISASGRVVGEAVTRALGVPPRLPFAWHHPDALNGLFAPHGFAVELEEHRHSFTAASLRAYVEDVFDNHPMWVAGRAVLEPRGEAAAVRERALQVLVDGNEDPDAFKVTSRYVVAVARPR